MLINRLSRLMGDRRLSIQAVHQGTGISYATMHDLYHDRNKRIDFATLDKLCNFFGVGPEQVFEWQADGESAHGEGQGNGSE